jgi:hypothetical protein
LFQKRVPDLVAVAVRTCHAMPIAAAPLAPMVDHAPLERRGYCRATSNAIVSPWLSVWASIKGFSGERSAFASQPRKRSEDP